MADITVAVASVVADTDATIDEGVAGATITAGQPIYKDTTNSNKLAPCDGDVLASSIVAGISLHAALAGQPIKYVTRGGVTLGVANLTLGQVYVASLNAGGIAPYADLGSGDFVSTIGIATTTSKLDVRLHNSGIAK